MARPKKLIIKKSVEESHVPGSLPPFQKEGVKRPYYSTALDSDFLKRTTVNQYDKIIALSLFALSVAFKAIDLGTPFTVVFDEIHIIKHVNKYINGEYFNDVTPPLSKLFYTFFAYMVGYRGDATGLTKAGQSYQETDFPYIFLRLITVLCSSFTLPLGYLTLRNFGVKYKTAGATMSLLLLENLSVLQSRNFSADAIFLFCLSFTVYSFSKFQISDPFTCQWFKYLAFTAVGLGLSVSTKWIGLATIGWVLILSLLKLWLIVGDIEISNKTILKHCFFKASFVVVPALLYLLTFFVHLLLLPHYARDASLLSTDFQRSLDFNDISEIPKYVTYGSTVTIRHKNSMGGYLHSHPYKYRGGSKNNQVTVFDYKDYNNEWIIEPNVGRVNTTDPRIKLNTPINLRHKLSGTLLSVSEKKPPISEQDYDFEISCLLNASSTPSEYEQFWIKGEADPNNRQNNYIKSFTTTFRLTNTKQSCTILSHDIRLPDWGFNQQEVICIKEPQLKYTEFYIENVKYPADFDYNTSLPIFKETQEKVDPNFFSKFFELNIKMYKLLKAIKVKVTTDPLTWPLDSTGMKITSLRNSTLYAIGNPIPFWLTVIFVLSYVLLQVLDLFKVDYSKESIEYKFISLELVLGYLIHYIPYLKLTGEWFLQYYLASLYFGILLIGVSFEFIQFKNPQVGKIFLILSILAAFGFYSSISPITFGSDWSIEACERAKFFSSWDFRCDMYKSESKVVQSFVAEEIVNNLNN